MDKPVSITTYVALRRGESSQLLFSCLKAIGTRWRPLLKRMHLILEEPTPNMCFAAGKLALTLGTVSMVSVEPDRVGLLQKAWRVRQPDTEFTMWFDAAAYVKPDVTTEHLHALIAIGGDLIAPRSPLVATAHPDGYWWMARTEALRKIGYPWTSVGGEDEQIVFGREAAKHGLRRHYLPRVICPVAWTLPEGPGAPIGTCDVVAMSESGEEPA